MKSKKIIKAKQLPANEDLLIENSRLEDWIDKTDLMKKLHLSGSSVDNYISQGTLHHTWFGGRKYFYLPHILRGFEQRYR